MENKELPQEENNNEGILSPFMVDEFGMVHDPIQLEAPSEAEMQKIAKAMKEKHLSDETYQRILKETNSSSAIVITFGLPITERIFVIRDFHISVLNVLYQNVPSVLDIVLKALQGQLGGSMNLRRNNGDDPPQKI